MHSYFCVTPVGDKFKVQITRKGKVFYLGTYEDIIEAATFADRYNISSSAWARNGQVKLNFRESTALDERLWNDQFKDMIKWLRHAYPEAEQSYKMHLRIDDKTPDLREEFNTMRSRLKDLARDVDTLLDTINAVTHNRAQLHASCERDLEWHRAKVAELEETIRKMRYVDDLKKANGGVLMRQVAGEGFVPPPAPPAPQSDPTAQEQADQAHSEHVEQTVEKLTSEVV